MKIMGEYHGRLLQNYEEDSLKETLMYLGEIAQKMIDQYAHEPSLVHCSLCDGKINVELQ